VSEVRARVEFESMMQSRLMVGRYILDIVIGVRFPALQPVDAISFNGKTLRSERSDRCSTHWMATKRGYVPRVRSATVYREIGAQLSVSPPDFEERQHGQEEIYGRLQNQRMSVRTRPPLPLLRGMEFVASERASSNGKARVLQTRDGGSLPPARSKVSKGGISAVVARDVANV
jgi:hypothetical protein